jgi:peptide/nickel transport system permease protein
MGTDDLGRDVFSGFMLGAKLSLLVGFLAAITSTIIGIIVGSIAGYCGGRIDNVMMRFTDVFMTIPQFVFALVIAALFGGSLWNVIWVIGVLYWPSTARLIRAEFLSLKEYEFVKAARALGMRDMEIIFGEILPNAISPAIVNASLSVASAILVEAGLSFLGLGDMTLRSWGAMLHDAQTFMREAWWMAVFPGLGIFFATWGFNSVGEGLNAALNPRLRER